MISHRLRHFGSQTMQATVWNYIQLAMLYEERGQFSRARTVRQVALVLMIREGG